MKKKKVEKKKEDKKLKEYDATDKQNKHFGFIKLDKLKKNLFPDKCYLINMELRNGDHKTFTIITSEPSFSFQGGLYIIDTELKYYNISAKMYAIDYHQDFSLPIKREIVVSDIQKGIESLNAYEIENATNPRTMKTFVESKIAEGIMKGQAIDEFFKSMKLWIIIGSASALIHLLLFVNKSGMLDSVKIPGITG